MEPQNRQIWKADGMSSVQIILELLLLMELKYHVFRQEDKKYFIQDMN